MKNRQLVHELLDAVLDLHESEDYVDFETSNHGFQIFLKHQAGGFDSIRDYECFEGFHFEDTQKLQEMIDYFRNIKKALTPASN